MSFDTTPYQTTPTPPPGPLQAAPKRRIGGLAWLAIIGIPVAAIAGFLGATNPGGDRNTEAYAIVKCQEAVKNQLKSPTTADFTGSSATGDGTWTVTGSVSSQNGFGATVRSSFQCSVMVEAESAGASVRVDSLTTP